MTVIGEAWIRIKGVADTDKSIGSVEHQIEGVGTTAERSGGKARAAFKQMGSALTSAFGPAFEPINEVIDKFGDMELAGGKFKENIGKNMLAVGGAVTAAGTALTLVSDKDKIASKQLKGSIEAAGGSWEKYKEETEKTIKTQEHFGHNAVDTQNTLKGLVTKTGDVEGSYKNMGLVADIAASKNISLTAAGKLVGQAMTGNTRVLKQFGVTSDDINKKIDTGAIKAKNQAMATALNAAASNKAAISQLKLRDAHLRSELAATKDKDAQAKIRAELQKDSEKRSQLTDAMQKNKEKAKTLKDEIKELSTGELKGNAAIDIISKKMHGQASDAADTFTGHIKEARAKIEDFIGSVGQKLGPALQVAGPAMMGFGAIIQSGIIGKLKDGMNVIKNFNVMTKIAGAATKVWTGIQAAFNIVMAMNPIVLITIAIVALVAAIVIAYVKFKPFRELINSIGKDIKDIFVKAIQFVIRVWQAFIGTFEAVWKAVVNIVKRYWPIILAILAPFIGIPLIIMKNWDKISKFFRDLWNRVYNTIKNFIDRIVTGIRGLWDKGSTLIRNFINTVVTTITGLPGKAAAALAQLGSKVAAKFTSMASTAGSKVSSFVSTVVSAVGGIPGQMVSKLSSLGTTVGTKIKSAFTNAKSWVTNAFSNAGSWLLDAGSRIIGGLADGLWNATVGKLTNTLGKVGSWIKSHKGPESVDRVMLVQSGHWIMGGLIKGIENKLPDLANSLQGVSKSIQSGINTNVEAGLNVPANANAAGIGSGKVVNLFPYANIDFGQQDPAQIIQSLENAIMASRL